MNNVDHTPATTETLPEMGILDHLRELRKRILYSLIAVFVCASVLYFYCDVIFEVLKRPFTVAFPNEKLIGTGPAEALILKMTVSLFGGMVVALPFLFSQVWLYISPALYSHERRMAIPFVVITTACFLAGVLFAYEAVLPYTFAFFHDEYESIGLAPQIRLSEHLSLTVKALLGFGAIFEMPVLSFLLARLGVITAETLINAGRFAIVAMFVIAAVLTPPDVVSQLIMVAPMLILYGISILVAKIGAKSPTP